MITADAHVILTQGTQQIAKIAPRALGIALAVVGGLALLALLPSYIAYRRLGRRPVSDDQVQGLDEEGPMFYEHGHVVDPDGRQAIIRRAREADRLEAELDVMEDEWRRGNGA